MLFAVSWQTFLAPNVFWIIFQCAFDPLTQIISADLANDLYDRLTSAYWWHLHDYSSVQEKFLNTGVDMQMWGQYVNELMHVMSYANELMHVMS